MFYWFLSGSAPAAVTPYLSDLMLLVERNSEMCVMCLSAETDLFCVWQGLRFTNHVNVCCKNVFYSHCGFPVPESSACLLQMTHILYTVLAADSGLLSIFLDTSAFDTILIHIISSIGVTYCTYRLNSVHLTLSLVHLIQPTSLQMCTKALS